MAAQTRSQRFCKRVKRWFEVGDPNAIRLEHPDVIRHEIKKALKRYDPQYNTEIYRLIRDYFNEANYVVGYLDSVLMERMVKWRNLDIAIRRVQDRTLPPGQHSARPPTPDASYDLPGPLLNLQGQNAQLVSTRIVRRIVE